MGLDASVELVQHFSISIRNGDASRCRWQATIPTLQAVRIYYGRQNPEAEKHHLDAHLPRSDSLSDSILFYNTVLLLH